MSLTRRTLLLAVVIAALGIVGTWSGAVETLWRIPAITIVVLLLIEYMDARGWPFELQLQQPAQIGLGAEHNATLSVSNRGGRRRSFRFCPRLPVGVDGHLDDARASLGPNQHTDHDFVIFGAVPGRHAWPQQPLEVDGLFGLAKWIRLLPVTATSRVVPDMRFKRIDGAGISRAGQRLDARIGGDADEHRGLRDYAPGDPPSSIDWKATARHRGLVVRDYAASQHVEMIIAIDVGQSSGLACGELTILGHVMNVSARLMALAAAQGDRCGLLIYADQVLATLPVGQGPSHHRRLHELLASATTVATESNPLPAMVSLSRLAQHRSLIVMFSELHDAQANGQLIRATRLLRGKHLPMIVGVDDPVSETLERQQASSWLDPFTSLAAIEYRRDAAITQRRLQRLGAEVVHAQPAQLDAAVLNRYAQLRSRNRI